MTIYFYTTRDAHGNFSNFSRHGFTLKGLWWPTSEHYFQAQKFAGTASTTPWAGPTSPSCGRSTS